MEFKVFASQIRKHFDEMVSSLKQGEKLFTVKLEKGELWNIYLKSFPEGTDTLYRENTSHNCHCCRHFVNRVGGLVAIVNNKLVTLWDFTTDDETYQPVIDAMAAYVRTKTIDNIFITKESKIGTECTHEQKATTLPITTWHHMSLVVPTNMIDNSFESIESKLGDARATHDVFKRSLEELSMDAVDTVLELIAQNSLYKGEEWKVVLKKFRKYKAEYESLKTEDKANYVWAKSVVVGDAVARIRNHSIGVLLTDITKDEDLDVAVKRYESVVAPENYKRPKAIFTKKMLEDAKVTVTELGYSDSLVRRFATLDDITINNILFSNKDAAKRIKGADVFEEMSNSLAINPRKFNKVEEISIEDFITNVLPTAKNLEVLFENKHKANLVSLVAPQIKGSKSMFKWDNNFSWAYTGNITDSSIKRNVKKAKGNVDGVLRFSIQWNSDTKWDKNDLDAHCIEPNGFHIYYGDKLDMHTTGRLDVDIQRPDEGDPAVENITWTTRQRMSKGVYKFYVKNYAYRGGDSGFSAEIEFDGQLYTFEYPYTVKQDEEVQVAEVTFDGKVFSIKEKLNSQVVSRETWGIQTNQFVPVSVMMHSPNYWDEQQGIGNKHYFFMLKGCVNEEKPHGFYNEFLKQELDKHKRVFEALGSKMAVETVADQLSGLGFSTTLRNDLIVKVVGTTERVLKIKF